MTGETQLVFLQNSLKRLDMTRAELAERLGVSTKTLNNWMATEHSSDFRALPKMAQNYISDLLKWDREKDCAILIGGIKSVTSKLYEGHRMTLRDRFLNDIIEGRIGNGLIVTRKAFMAHYHDENPAYTGVFLSNSEMTTGGHSPTWDHFTSRVSPGVYRVHPVALLERMRPERHIELTVVKEPDDSLSLYILEVALGPQAKHRGGGRLAENKNHTEFYQAVADAIAHYTKDGDTTIHYIDLK